MGDIVLNTAPITEGQASTTGPACCGHAMRQMTTEIASFYCEHCGRFEVVSTGDEELDTQLLKKAAIGFKRLFGDA